MKGPSLHFLWVSITQNDQTDTLLPFQLHFLEMTTRLPPYFKQRGHNFTLALYTGLKLKGPSLHFLLVSITQNDQTDTLLSFQLHVLEMTTLLPPYFKQRGHNFTLALYTGLKLKGPSLHFLLVSITQNDQTDTLLSFQLHFLEMTTLLPPYFKQRGHDFTLALCTGLKLTSYERSFIALPVGVNNSE